MLLLVIPDADEAAGRSEGVPGDVEPICAGEELVGVLARLQERDEALGGYDDSMKEFELRAMEGERSFCARGCFGGVSEKVSALVSAEQKVLPQKFLLFALTFCFCF